MNNKVISIKLADYFDNQIISRSSINTITSNLVNDNEYYIDFKNIKFISRAAAHELNSTVNGLMDRNISISYKNVPFKVKMMLDRVGVSTRDNFKHATFLKHINFNTERELDQFLQTV